MASYFVVSVNNTGGYVARFSVTYKEKGVEITKDSGDFTAGVKKSIEIPGDATPFFFE